MASLNIHIEFKWSFIDDPFVVLKSTEKSFVASGTNAQDMLGQISSYATV
jgi:hypothetical protein